MLKGLGLFFAVLVGGMIYFHQVLKDGRFLQFVDRNAEKVWAPQVTYTVGQGYYIFQNLPEATTYFLRVAQRYPKKDLAERAYFNYLQCLDDMANVPRATLAEGYQAYLERYPNGTYAEIAKNRLGAIQSNR